MLDDIKNVFKMIEENNVKYVDFRFTDPRGKWQHTAQSVGTVDEDMLTDGIMFDGSSIAGWKDINESDMTLMPDCSTAVMDPFAAQEQEAFSGIESLARGPGAAPAFEIARTASLGAAAPITAAEIQQGMNPYQQAVTDIAKREAARQYQRGPQAQLRTGAVESGGLRGARRFIEEAEGQRNLQQQMSDLQTVGSQQAYNQSLAEAAKARGRLANLAAQMPSIGTGAYQQQLAQYGQLGGVGETQRAREQAAIDLAQSQFQR